MNSDRNYDMIFLEGFIVREDFIEKIFELRCQLPEKSRHASILGQNVLYKENFYFSVVETLIRCLWSMKTQVTMAGTMKKVILHWCQRVPQEPGHVLLLSLWDELPLIFLVQCQGVLEQRNNIVSPALCFSEHVRGWEDSAIIEHLSGISKILGFCPALKKCF